MLTARELAERVGAKRIGPEYRVTCPAHPDTHPSLDFHDGEKGIVFQCRSRQCGIDAILGAWGLTVADVMNGHGPQDHPTFRYFVYTDERGAPRSRTVRREPGFNGKRKSIWQEHITPAGEWVKGTDGVRRVPYRLRELQGQTTVYIPEGEPHCDRLAALGFPATCNVGGAGKWTDEDTRLLVQAGIANVVALADHDQPGREHVEIVARSCDRAGLKVKVLSFPDVPEKGDVLDWLASGHTREELAAIVKATPLYSPTDAAARAIDLTDLRDLLAEPDETADYLVTDRIAIGSVNLLPGKPKGGKSTTARALAFEVARGGSWLGFTCLQRPVWYLALEDERSEVRRHFRQMGATGTEPIRFLFRQPAEGLIGRLYALAQHEQPGLIVVDTLQRLIKADDLNDYAEVTTKLTPILTLARDTGAAVLLLHHATKSERSGLDSVLGSTALTGSVDNVFLLTRTDRYRVLSSIQRIGPDLPETVLVLDEATGQVKAGPSRHEADVAAVERAFVQALDSGSLNRGDLLDHVEARRQLKLEALRRALDLGTIIRAGAGTKADPHRFSLPVGSGSGSQVPAYRGEPESSLSLFGEKPNDSAADCGSQVPQVPRFPREPESAAPKDHNTEPGKEAPDAGVF